MKNTGMIRTTFPNWLTSASAIPRTGASIGVVHLVPYWPFGLIFMTYRKLPDRPKIVIFHGRPNPDELVNDDIGYWSIGRRHAYGGIGWVADYLQKYGS